MSLQTYELDKLMPSSSYSILKETINQGHKLFSLKCEVHFISFGLNM